MKKTLTILTCIATVILAANAQQTAEKKFNQDGWGVSIQGEFDVEKNQRILNSPPLGYEHRGPSSINNVSECWSIGATAIYVWHPLKNQKADFAKHFFTQFGLGGEYNRFEQEKNFTFNARVLLGYTFNVRNVGIDVYTGPVAQFAPKRDKYVGPCITVDTNNPDWDGSWGPDYTICKYLGGAQWRFGVGVNIGHVGFFAAFNQPMGNYLHYWTEGAAPQYKLIDNRRLKTTTIGMQVRF